MGTCLKRDVHLNDLFSDLKMAGNLARIYRIDEVTRMMSSGYGYALSTHGEFRDRRDDGGRKYAVITRGGGGGDGPLPKTLTLFMTKICDFPYPIYEVGPKI